MKTFGRSRTKKVNANTPINNNRENVEIVNVKPPLTALELQIQDVPSKSRGVSVNPSNKSADIMLNKLPQTSTTPVLGGIVTGDPTPAVAADPYCIKDNMV